MLSCFDSSADMLNVAPDIAAVHPTKEFDPAWWVDRLGGTRLIAKQLATIPTLTPEAINDLLDVRIHEIVVSSPNVPPHIRSGIVKGLKKLRSKLRYRENSDAYAASGLSERLIRRDDAAEVLLLQVPEGFIVSIVVAVQDVHAWTERDRTLPAVDAVEGMLPPKLARIMVNLAEPARPANQPGVLLDPFCGSGQIPVEALRLDWKTMASDISQGAIERTNANCDWAIGNYRLDPSHLGDIQAMPIVEASTAFAAKSIDAIVAEPDLGPPLRSESQAPSNHVLDSVAKTVTEAFEAGRVLLRPGGRLVFIIPIIAGVRIADRLDESVFSGYLLRETLRYARPDARVERELFIFDRT